MRIKSEDRLIAAATRNPKYRGKQVVVVDNEIHILSTQSRQERAELLASLVKKHPLSVPTIAFIPREDALILIL